MGVSVSAQLIAVGIALAAGGVPRAVAFSAPPILTSARAAHDLSPAEARQALPVHFRATVTYYDPFIDARHAALFVCDPSGCIFVRVGNKPSTPLRGGDVIRLDGVTASGDYAPVIDPTGITVLEKGGLPRTAVRASVPRVLSGALDGQWVELEGVVHSVHLSEHNVFLEIETIDGDISAISVREAGRNYDFLTDALIRIRANAAPMFNRNRQMIGGHLFFPSLDTVRVIQGAPADPFAIPVVSPSHLLQFTPGLRLAHRMRVRGRVTLQWPGRMLCVQQEANGICMQTSQFDPVPVGAEVDLVGFPEILGLKPTLENANYRRAPAQESIPLVQPRRVSGAEALTANYDGDLVELEGQLLDRDHATGDYVLLLRSGEVRISAILPRGAEYPDSTVWPDGSRVRVTGVCNAQVSPGRTSEGEGAVRVDSVQILLRSAADVRVLARPSWWTPRRTLAILAIVVMIAFAALVWVIVLRLRVDRQTEALRRSEEQLRHLSQHDPLTGLPNRILLNDRLVMALKRRERFDGSLALMMVDLDHFKEVNDTLGHHAGDQVLCEVARRIERVVRQTDTVARLGGDEFVVLLPDLHEAVEAERVAAKIVAAVAEPIQLGGPEFDVSVSVGVCTAPRFGADAEELLQAADRAMYRAKARGKDCYYMDYGAADRPALHSTV